MNPDEIRPLPGSWYVVRPIPPRLIGALSDPPTYGREKVPRSIIRALALPAAKRSTVEQAHVRATNRLLR